MSNHFFTSSKNLLLVSSRDFRIIETEYLKKRTVDFERIFDSETKEKYNVNISPLFYDKKAYDEYMNQNEKTELEMLWKTRVLLEYTPRGNVSMYYDPFKMGFSYYSDQKTISYELLNACAMKYVKLFRCRDFFVDELTTPTDNKNPLIALYYTVEQKLTHKPVFTPLKNSIRTSDDSSTKLTPQGSTDSKLHRYKTVENGPFIKRQKNDQTLQKNSEPEKMKNKFLYLGKLSNNSFLNIPEKKVRMLSLFKSPLLDGIEQNAEAQNQRFSYKDFKKLGIDSSKKEN